MSSAASCPSIQDWEQFVHRRHECSRVDALTRHLAQCNRCNQIVRACSSKQPPTMALAQEPTPQATVAVPAPIPGDGASAASRYEFLSTADVNEDLGFLNHYRLIKVLGEGGMGMVLKAEDPQLHRFVALKVMKPELADDDESRDRFIREARAMAAIKHDHVVTVYHVGQESRVVYLAMEFLEGENLFDRLQREEPLPVRAVTRVGREIASGLHAAHARGLIHRDIKPANIWLEAPDGRVKILDFGLARPTDDNVGMTQTGMILGTPAYMSPEQARGETVDGRSDLFSLGILLYRMCTGASPFQGNTTTAVLTALAVDHPPPIHEVNPAIPRPLSDVVMRMLAKAPKDRVQSAQEVVDAMRAIEGSGGPSPAIPVAIQIADSSSARTPHAIPIPTASIPQPNIRRPNRKIIWAAGLFLLVLLAIVAAGSWLGPTGSSPVTSETKGKPPPVAKLPDKFITNSIGMKLILVPAGKFLMGSPKTEKGHEWEEGPQHQVEITRPFYMSIHEVTQDQYKKVIGANHSHFSATGPGKDMVKTLDPDQLPVEQVTWDQAKTFCRKLSSLAAEKKAGHAYRLPTEAEWEYACRGGSKQNSPFYFGTTITPREVNFAGQNLMRTATVGSDPPNKFGLYDMHGNVWEWCEDWYDDGYYLRSPAKDPTGPKGPAKFRVIRGGSWIDAATTCRSAHRGRMEPEGGLFVGIRVVCPVKMTK